MLNKRGWKLVRRLGDGTLVSYLSDYIQTLGAARAELPGLQVYAPGVVTCPDMPSRGPLALFGSLQEALDYMELELHVRCYECDYEPTDIEGLWGIDEVRPAGEDHMYMDVPPGTVFASAIRLLKEVPRDAAGD